MREKVKILYQPILLIILSNGYAQSITSPFEILKQNKEIVYGLDNRRTHINEHHTVIYGMYSGISFGKKLRFKIGLNGTPFEVGQLIDDNGLLKKNRLIFASIGEEFDFYQFKKLGLTTYLQGGVGHNLFREINTNGLEFNTGKDLVIPFETGLPLNYDRLTHVKLRTEFGWRFVAPNNSKAPGGCYLKLGLGVNFKQLHNSRITERRNRQLHIGYFAPYLTHIGGTLGYTFDVKKLKDNPLEPRKSNHRFQFATQISYSIQRSVSQNLFFHPELVYRWNRFDKRFFLSSSIGTGYLLSFQKQNGSLNLGTGQIDYRYEAINYFLPTLNLGFGLDPKTHFGFYFRTNFGNMLSVQNARSTFFGISSGVIVKFN